MRDYAQAKCIPGFLKVSASCWQVPLVAGLGFGVRRIALFPFLSYSSSSPLDLDLVQVLSWHSSTFVSTLPLLLSILDLLSHFFNLHRMAAYLHESGWPPHLHRP